MVFNLKKQIRNKYFWVSVISLIIMTLQMFNLDILPSGFEEYANSVLTILVGVGILNNNMSEGLGE